MRLTGRSDRTGRPGVAAIVAAGVVISAVCSSVLLAAPAISGWEVAVTHGGAGEIFVPIGNPYIEPRNANITKLRATASEPLDPNTVGGGVAAIHSLQTGDQSSLIGNVTLDPNATQITITLTGPLATDEAYSIKLAATIESAGGEPLSGTRTLGIARLVGDADHSGQVDQLDMIRVRNRFGSVDPNEPAYDLDANGTVDAEDVVVARARLDQTASMPTFLSVVPYKSWIAEMGQTQQLTVSVHTTDDEVFDITAAAKGTDYDTSDANVATVSAAGLITPLADGEATITASFFGLSDTCKVRVITTPAVPTNESGWIDGIVYDATSDSGLAGAIVTVKGVTGRVLSGGDGKFAFPTPGSGLFFTSIYKNGYTYNQRRVEVTRTLDTATYAAYLLPEAAPMQPAGPAPMRTVVQGELVNGKAAPVEIGQMYTNKTGSVQIIFPASSRHAKAAIAARGMALGQEGDPPPPDITATEVTRSLELPDALPEQSEFTYAFFFDIDGEDELPEPVTVRFANTRGFAPATEIPVGRWDNGLLKWVHQAVGVVSPDGQWVEFQTNHFSACDINLPIRTAPGSGNPDPNFQGDPEVQKPPENCNGNAASYVAARTGELLEDHALPSYRSQGAERTVRFVYQSRAAKPTASIAYDLTLPGFLLPEAHGFRVSIEGRLYESWMQGTDTSRRHAFLWDGVNDRSELLPTGCYYHYVRLTNEYRANFATSASGLFAGPPGQDLGIQAPERVLYPAYGRGTVMLRNERASPFGAGWTVAGLQRLIIDTAQTRALLIQGDGSAITFKAGPDFAVAHSAGMHVSVGLGNGDGTFQEVQAYPVDSSSGWEVVVADFDRDGRQDLAVQCQGGLYVLLGNGDGTFQDAQEYVAGGRGIAVGDLDGDGCQDLVTANYPGRWVIVLLGNGDGTFQDLQAYEAPHTVQDVAVGDFDGDGQQDVVSAHHQGSVLVFLGNGDGTLQDWQEFEALDPGQMPVGLFVEDLNGDGHQDVVGGSNVTTYVFVLLGNGDGTFQPRQRIDAVRNWPTDVAAADFDEDGHLDLITCSQVLLLGNGDGTFGDPGVVISTRGGNHVAVADLDGDGHQDFVTTRGTWFGGSGCTVDAFLGYGNGAFQFKGLTSLALDSFPMGVCVGDFDRTGGVFVSPPGEHSTLRGDPNSPGYIRTMKDGTLHHFDSDGFITSTVDRNGNTTTYAYTGSGQDKLLASITDPVGKVTTFSYSGGKVQSITDPASRTTQFQIDGAGDLIRITNPDASFRQFEYDTDHLMTAQIDAGGTRTVYVYDPNGYGCVTEVIKAVGTADEQHRYFQASINQGLINDLPAGVGTRDNPAPVVRPGDIGESYTNGEGETQLYYTNRFGFRTVIEDPNGRITLMDRDSFNQVTRLTLPEENKIDYEYDRKGNVTKITVDPNGLNLVTTLEYDPNWNRPTRIEDPEQHAWVLAYDPNGNLLSITDPMTRATTFAYNTRGQVEQITNAENEFTQFEYYADTGNLWKIIADPNGQPLTTTLEYDDYGNVSKVTDPNGNDANYVHDVMNLLRFVTDAEGHTTEYQYEAALGTISRWSSSPLARLHKIIDARPVDAVTYGYDALHRLTTETDPNGHTLSYEYDDADRLVLRTDPNGQTIAYVYDDSGWRISKTLPTPNAPETVTYEYDDNGNLTRAADADSDLSFGYDDADRLTSYASAAVAGQPALSLGYAYHDDGLLDTMTDPTGATVYVHNASHWLTQITDTAGRVTGFGHDNAGRRTSMTYQNNTSVAYVYDDAGRLTNIVHKLAATPFLSLAYTRDGAGNIRTMTDNAGLHTYGYDKTYQLTDANHPDPNVNPNETYTYDPVGNRLTSHLSSSHTHNTANQLLEDDDYTYTYDNNGNLKTKTAKVGGAATTYTYDAENRLTRVDLPAGQWATYRYDALSRRTEKNVNGTITHYTYDAEDILFEYDPNNTVVARYTHGPAIDEPLIMARSGQPYYYHADHLRTIRALTDPNGTVAQTYTYETFGRIMAQTGAIPNPYAYSGREWDSESGLYYYRARHYSPQIGRFLQVDPADHFRGFHLYAYTNNSPMTWIDPWGLARIGSRKLDGNVPFNGSGRVRHDQIWYDDGGNTGFFNDDKVRSDKGHDRSEYDFSRNPTEYDDCLLRQAEKNVRKRWDMDWRLGGNNCQDYVDAVKKEYERLKGGQTQNPRAFGNEEAAQNDVDMKNEWLR